MVQISSNFLFTAFILYLIATLFFGGAIKEKGHKWANVGITITILGFIAQTVYFVTRWIASGHAPVSNFFEFGTFFGMMLVGAFIVMYFMYRVSIIGLFALPVALLLIAYASMFPREISPLIPSLKSNWLHIHVTTAAAGQAILAISFITGVMYLLKNVDQSVKSKRTFWLETVVFTLVCTVGFIGVTTVFSSMKYEAKFQWIDKNEQQVEMKYNLPALVGPHEGKLLTENKLEPTVEVPAIVNAKKLNTVVWSVLVGTLLYIVLRLVLRKRVSAALQPLVKNTISFYCNWIPSFHIRCINFCHDLGSNSVDTFLGLGSKRGLGAYYLALLCCGITFTFIKRMAWREVSVVSGNWFCNYYV